MISLKYLLGINAYIANNKEFKKETFMCFATAQISRTFNTNM